MLDNLKEFYMAVFYYFSKSVNKMITVGLNSAVDAKMIQVITLKKRQSIIRDITHQLHMTNFVSTTVDNSICIG